MQLKTWLDKWGMSSLKINPEILEMELDFRQKDRDAAWDLYIELLTRITTQPLAEEAGDENAALNSVHKLFDITRETIKSNGRECIQFARIAVIILNQVIRPFTAKWQRKSLAGALERDEDCMQFRMELADLQDKLRKYTHMLADIAGVEDLTTLEAANRH
jgi:hypothetical protein